MEEAINVAASMPCQPNNFVWGHCLVVACSIMEYIWLDIYKILVEVDPGNSAGHVMLDNVFAVSSMGHCLST